ncbi:hypothetical protein SJI19_16105 [Acerihabitans sp. TG2]|uniref:hypothetical protein n=1 Tax=Acerihabitans sp. TG2 TaxID=3096008 RepID=UPI002B228C36|nr:hypothetical protein [Acerihabitans sp. TG2]MEA9392049.1 hypothetical protein [Acerihabitans sp. TG2]
MKINDKSQIWRNARSSGLMLKKAERLRSVESDRRERLLIDEVSAKENSLAEFAGVEAYEAAGGEMCQDLLTETGSTSI